MNANESIDDLNYVLTVLLFTGYFWIFFARKSNLFILNYLLGTYLIFCIYLILPLVLLYLIVDRQCSTLYATKRLLPKKYINLSSPIFI